MDTWRHLPNYQLERRADLFFSLYLPLVLQKKTGTNINPNFIPEFPVRIGTIEPNSKSNQSKKIDYLALSQDGTQCFLIELKTDLSSRNDTQDTYLIQSKELGIPTLLDGVQLIFKATNAKRKYFCLLQQLEDLKQITIPQKMKEIIKRKSLQGITSAADDITITTKVQSIQIIYIQQNGNGNNIINFEEFASIIENINDSIAPRFAKSLREWASTQAGSKSNQ